jgi:hypothetical protein
LGEEYKLKRALRGGVEKVLFDFFNTQIARNLTEGVEISGK